MNNRTLRLNEAERLRLEALAAPLSERALALRLENGWTVAVALAHLAFWEKLDADLLRCWLQGNAPMPEPAFYADAVNRAMTPQWQALPPQDALRLAIEATREIDAVVAAVPDWVLSEMRARGEMWWVRRYLHRREHLSDIEAALAAK